MTVLDGSAALTGLLLAFTLPPSVPLWISSCGFCFFDSGRQTYFRRFWGIIYLILRWLAGHFFLPHGPVLHGQTGNLQLTGLPKESAAAVDAVTTATPLAAMKLEGQVTSLLDLFIGNTGGSLGENICPGSSAWRCLPVV